MWKRVGVVFTRVFASAACLNPSLHSVQTHQPAQHCPPLMPHHIIQPPLPHPHPLHLHLLHLAREAVPALPQPQTRTELGVGRGGFEGEVFEVGDVEEGTG